MRQENMMRQLQDKVSAVEGQLLDAAITKATSQLSFANDACRAFALETIRMRAKKESDGTYSCDGLPLGYYIKNQGDWLPGMLAEAPAGDTPAVSAQPDGYYVARNNKAAPGTFNIEDISPTMTEADRVKVTSVIAAELAKLR